jgi:hypothetical protein
MPPSRSDDQAQAARLDGIVLCIGHAFGRNCGDRAIYYVLKETLDKRAGLRTRHFPMSRSIAAGATTLTAHVAESARFSGGPAWHR